MQQLERDGDAERLARPGRRRPGRSRSAAPAGCPCRRGSGTRGPARTGTATAPAPTGNAATASRVSARSPRASPRPGPASALMPTSSRTGSAVAGSARDEHVPEVTGPRAPCGIATRQRHARARAGVDVDRAGRERPQAPSIRLAARRPQVGEEADRRPSTARVAEVVHPQRRRGRRSPGRPASVSGAPGAGSVPGCSAACGEVGVGLERTLEQLAVEVDRARGRRADLREPHPALPSCACPLLDGAAGAPSIAASTRSKTSAASRRSARAGDRSSGSHRAARPGRPSTPSISGRRRGPRSRPRGPQSTAASMQPALRPQSIQSPASTRFS